jgi:hypothetical protein
VSRSRGPADCTVTGFSRPDGNQAGPHQFPGIRAKNRARENRGPVRCAFDPAATRLSRKSGPTVRTKSRAEQGKLPLCTDDMQHASPLWRIRGTNAWTIVRQSRLASKLHGVKERGLSLARTARTVKRDVWGTTKIYGNETAKSAAFLMTPWEDGTVTVWMATLAERTLRMVLDAPPRDASPDGRSSPLRRERRNWLDLRARNRSTRCHPAYCK